MSENLAPATITATFVVVVKKKFSYSFGLCSKFRPFSSEKYLSEAGARRGRERERSSEGL